MDPGVLADVQPRVVKAEHLDLADHVAQIAGGGQRPRALDQRALHQPQIGQQLARLGVAALAARLGARAPARARTSAPAGRAPRG